MELRAVGFTLPHLGFFGFFVLSVTSSVNATIAPTRHNFFVLSNVSAKQCLRFPPEADVSVKRKN